MKKAILIEPELLAEIKLKSPAVYEYYINSSYYKEDYIDYGSDAEPMFMRLDYYMMLLNKMESSQFSSSIIDFVKLGYRVGKADLENYLCEPSNIHSFHKTSNHLLNIVLCEQVLPDTERLMLINNKGRVMYKGPYFDGIFFHAWENLFSFHFMHNELFKEINKKNPKFGPIYNRKHDLAYPLN